jgi:N-acetylglutamate synthase/N-acetylornithine aminotransferase
LILLVSNKAIRNASFYRETHMGKQKAVVTVAEAARGLDGIRKAASMAGCAMARLETEAECIAASTGKAGRSLRMVSGESQLSALIRCGGTTIQIEGDDFAVSMNAAEA